jgi:hypothetical protein
MVSSPVTELLSELFVEESLEEASLLLDVSALLLLSATLLELLLEGGVDVFLLPDEPPPHAVNSPERITLNIKVLTCMGMPLDISLFLFYLSETATLLPIEVRL